MDTSLKTIQNNALAALSAHAPQKVLNSIQKASARTGVNFAYLMQQAKVESSFKADAKAKTSSASGLYQFIEGTWLSMVKKYGDKYGMGDLASHISDSGKVDSKAVKQQILALRNDPEKASALAAEFASENKKFLDSHWGGTVGSTELYLAHFMGAAGAAAFMKEKDENPLQQAAVLFPDAAKSNRNVFYDTKTGRPRTMDEVYAFFDRKFEVKDNTGMPPVAQDALQVANTTNTDTTSSNSRAYNDAMQSLIFNDNHQTARAFGSLFSPSYQNMVSNPVEILMMSQMELPIGKKSENM